MKDSLTIRRHPGGIHPGFTSAELTATDRAQPLTIRLKQPLGEGDSPSRALVREWKHESAAQNDNDRHDPKSASMWSLESRGCEAWAWYGHHAPPQRRGSETSGHTHHRHMYGQRHRHNMLLDPTRLSQLRQDSLTLGMQWPKPSCPPTGRKVNAPPTPLRSRLRSRGHP